jgi:hypothetical protein
MHTTSSSSFNLTPVTNDNTIQPVKQFWSARIQEVLPKGAGDGANINCRITYDEAGFNTEASPQVNDIALNETAAVVAALCPQMIALTRTTATGGGTIYLHSGLIYPEPADETTFRRVTFLKGKGNVEYDVTETVAQINTLTQAAASANSVPYQATAYVRGGGNDSTAQIGYPDLPYLTVQAAVDAASALGNGSVEIGVGAEYGTGIVLRPDVTLIFDPSIRNISWNQVSAFFQDTAGAATNVIIRMNKVTVQASVVGAQYLSITNPSTTIDIFDGNWIENAALITSPWVINDPTGVMKVRFQGSNLFLGSNYSAFQMEDATVVHTGSAFIYTGAGDAVFIGKVAALNGSLQLNDCLIENTNAASNSVDAQFTGQTLNIGGTLTSRYALNATNITTVNGGGETPNTSLTLGII